MTVEAGQSMIDAAQLWWIRHHDRMRSCSLHLPVVDGKYEFRGKTYRARPEEIVENERGELECLHLYHMTDVPEDRP
jgi:hypothetical protein